MAQEIVRVYKSTHFRVTLGAHVLLVLILPHVVGATHANVKWFKVRTGGTVGDEIQPRKQL